MLNDVLHGRHWFEDLKIELLTSDTLDKIANLQDRAHAEAFTSNDFTKGDFKRLKGVKASLQFDPKTGVYFDSRGKARGAKNKRLFWDDRVSGWRATLPYTEFVSLLGPR